MTSVVLVLSTTIPDPTFEGRGQIADALFRRLQRVHREHPCCVRPGLAHPPPGAARQRGEALDAVFVAVLGVDALALPEREARAEHAYRLALLADQMHLDPVLVAIVDRAVRE